MTVEFAEQLERLDRERGRLEALLARHPAWLGLKGLDRLRPPADAAERAMRARQRAELERLLSGNPVFEAHRSVMSAIGVLEDLLAADEAQQSEPVSAALAVHVQPRGGGSTLAEDSAAAAVRAAGGMRRADAERVHYDGSGDDAGDGSRPRRAELMALSASREGVAVTHSAVIHEGPPGRSGPTVCAVSEGPPDDLTRIRHIDKKLAAALIAHGVRRFEDIAAFTAVDVRALAAALALGRRISRENWIEQAALLAMKAKAAARPVPSTKPVDSIAAEVSEVSEAAGVGAPAEAPASSSADGAGHAPQPAVVATAPLVAAVARQIAARMVNARPASGESRETALVLALASAAAIAEPEPIAQPVVRVDDARDDAAGAGLRIGALVRQVAARISTATRPAPLPEAVPAEQTVAVAAVPETEPECAPPDDLTLIRGIDTELAGRLADVGVTRFSQIAGWGSNHVAALRAWFGPQVPISAAGWIEQAALLAGGGTTAHARRVLRGDLSALVSRPPDPVARDAGFAAWLAAHSARHEARVAPSVVAEPEPQREREPEPVVRDADLQAPGSGDAEPGRPAGEEVADDWLAVDPQTGCQAEPDRETPQEAEPEFAHEPALAAVADSEFAFEPTPGPLPSTPAAALVPEPVPHIPAHAFEQPPPSLPPAGIGHFEPLPPVATPPAEPVMPPQPAADARLSLSIVDRITAIERDAARLTLPLPPRRTTSLFGADAHTVSLPHSASSATLVASDTNGEADVKIVSCAGSTSAAPVGAADDFDKDDYAAYRDRIEEASVEIVTTGRDSLAAGPGINLSGPAPTAGMRARAMAGISTASVGRFFRALKGD